MSDTEEFAANTGEAPPSRKGKRKLLVPIIVVAIMLGEGGGLFIATKLMYGPPEAAGAAELTEGQKNVRAVQEEVEIELPEVNAFNKREGRLYLYNLTVTLRVKKENAEEVRKIVEVRKSTILDRFNIVVRSAETKQLNEPGLDTIRRQFRFELDRLLGDDQLIQEVLIPRFFQSPADV